MKKYDLLLSLIFMVLFYNITHAQKTVTLNAIHPEWRTEYFPNNTVAISNPVSLLTPT